jgi:hypothetical protein
LNAEAVAIGGNRSLLRTYFAHFSDSPDFIVEGQECAIHADAFLNFVPPEDVSQAEHVYTPLIEKVGEGIPEDVSQAENTEWATRVPAATPLGRTVPTSFSIGTGLPVSNAVIHSPATPTGAFSRSVAFSASNSLSPSGVFQRTASFTRSETFTPHRTRTPLPEEKTLSYSDVVVTVESMTMSMSESEVTSVSYEEIVVVSIEVSYDASNNTVTIERTSVSLAITIVRSAQFIAIDLPVFITTMSRVELQMDRYTTAPAKGMDNATLIGAATGAAFIAALLMAVVVFLVRKGKTQEMDSAVDFDDLDGTTVRSTRSTRSTMDTRNEEDSDFSYYSEGNSSSSSSQYVEAATPANVQNSRYLQRFLAQIDGQGSGSGSGQQSEYSSGSTNGDAEEDVVSADINNTNVANGGGDDWDLWA